MDKVIPALNKKHASTEFQLVEETGINREHAEFHNAYQKENIKNDISVPLRPS